MTTFLKSRGYKTYNKAELFNKIDAIEIFQEANKVITKYFGTVINITNVSDRYEIFDIKGFMKSKIEFLEANFNISFYHFRMRKGIQELTLLSDEVEIGGIPFHKAFFILNSSDKSRRLNMNLGLYQANNGVYFVNSIKNFSLTTKHLKGITSKAEVASDNMSVETFDEQIKSINSLFGERVMLSKVREIIIDKDQKVNHNKFDALKNVLRFDFSKGLTREQMQVLKTPSEQLVIDSKNDFSFDAFNVFRAYMSVFRNQDSYVVKRETEKILKITQCFLREEKLSQLLDMLD
jgi:hypothetical protein